MSSRSPAGSWAVERAFWIATTNPTIASSSSSASRSRAPTGGQRATMSSSGSVARCGMAAQSASVTKWHHRMEQTQVRVEDLDQGPPGRLADLVGQLWGEHR